MVHFSVLCLLLLLTGPTFSFLTLPSFDIIKTSQTIRTTTNNPITIHTQRPFPLTFSSLTNPSPRPPPPRTTTTSSLNSVAAAAAIAINPQSIAWVASTVLGGALGAPLVMKATRTWYTTIPLPTYTPPNGIFGPVWSLLYTSMGVASFRIRTILSANTSTTTATASYCANNMIRQYIMLFSYIHFFMNISWAPIFFGMKRFRLGHIVNIAIWLSLIPVMIGYYTIDVVSGILLIPYFLWLSFAIRLSHGICTLNPTDTSTKQQGRLFNNAKLEDEIWKLRTDAGKRVGL